MVINYRCYRLKDDAQRRHLRRMRLLENFDLIKAKTVENESVFMAWGQVSFFYLYTVNQAIL